MINCVLWTDDKKDDRFFKQADKIRNRGGWTLHKKHIDRRSILPRGMPKCTQNIAGLAVHYGPVCDPRYTVTGFNFLPPSENGFWAIPKDEQDESEGDHLTYITKLTRIASRLRSENNLSALGLDGIGYLFLKLGEEPMIKWLSKVFKACIESRKVPDTWKRSRLVILYKKGDTMIPSNGRLITITSGIYRLFMSLTAQDVHEKVHCGGKRQILLISQKLEGIKFIELHRIDYRMISADL
jgi:hypothetical protein